MPIFVYIFFLLNIMLVCYIFFSFYYNVASIYMIILPINLYTAQVQSPSF